MLWPRKRARTGSSAVMTKVGECLAGGPRGVDRIGVRSGPPCGAPDAVELDSQFTGVGQVARQAGVADPGHAPRNRPPVHRRRGAPAILTVSPARASGTG